MSGPGAGQPGDTYSRSCQHWTEAARAEMDAFYTLATADYRHLAEALDWAGWLERHQARAGERSLRLLDVACGSGKFPTALVDHARVAEADVRPIAYDLLDPSGFSIAEACAALRPPFQAGAEFEVPMQGFVRPDERYDVVWATHALYAVTAAELDEAMRRFVDAIRPGGTGAEGGTGFIANATSASHYLRFYRAFLDSVHGGAGEMYRSSEEIVASLERVGATTDVREIAYAQESGDDRVVEGYLQRCAFDDTVPLATMRRIEPLAAYLDGCRTDDGWRFEQRVALIFVTV